MSRIARNMLTSAAALAVLSPTMVAPFASDAAATTAEKPKRPKAPAPVIGEIANDIPIPAIVRAAPGSKSPFPWDALEIGQSFPVMNKTPKQMSSIVSNQNRKDSNFRQKVDGEGKPIFKTVPVLDGEGKEVAGMTKQEPEMEQIKIFVVGEYKANPKAKAETRVWRKQ
jgi:hypothetical protein